MAPHKRDAQVGSYEHLDNLPRAAEALNMLKKIASVVKPIMRGRGWKVGILTEFAPPEPSLLGLNINGGQRICLRLRYAGDYSQFMPLENVIDTMLHELSHNVHGPHDEHFHKLWDALRDEYTDLKIKGYTGEGFLSEGRRLGGHLVPIDEARRQARVAAEKRKALQRSAGQKLGGRPILLGSNIRSIIADAAQRRIAITEGCASGTQDGEHIANEGAFNGFRTQAEEDDANERAINQALWELVQEEAANKAGAETENQAWNSEGLTWSPATGLDINSSGSASSEPQPRPLSTPPVPARSPLRKPVALGNLKIPGASSLAAADGRSLSALPQTTYSKQGDQFSQLSRTRSVRANADRLVNEETLPTLKPAVYQETAASLSENSTNGGPNTSSELPILSPAVYNGQAPTLAPTTYKPTSVKSPGSNSSPVNIDISGFDDDYHGPGTGGSSVMRPAASSLPSRTWTCPVCTLCNRVEHLCCDVCGAEQPTRDETPITPIDVDNDRLSEAEIAHIERQMVMREREQEFEVQAAAERARLYGMAPQREVVGPIGWSCRACGSFMDNQWWTCSACGRMKDSS